MCVVHNHITILAVVRKLHATFPDDNCIYSTRAHYTSKSENPSSKHCSIMALQLKYTFFYLIPLFVYYTETTFPTSPVISGSGYRLPWCCGCTILLLLHFSLLRKNRKHLESQFQPSAVTTALFEVEEQQPTSWSVMHHFVWSITPTLIGPLVIYLSIRLCYVSNICVVGYL